MPFADFDAARAVYARDIEPVTFKLCDEIFTALREPMFGDVLVLWNAPELSDNEAAATLALTKFIRAMIDPEDRARYDLALYRLPQSQAGMTLMTIGAYIAEHMTGFPTTPPDSSVPTPLSTGGSSKQSTGGGKTSSVRRRTSGSGSSTGTSPGTATKPKSGRSTGNSSSSRRKS